MGLNRFAKILLLGVLAAAGFAASASGADFYVDNRLVASGLVTLSGNDADEINLTGVTFQTGFTDSDVVGSGLIITAGGGAAITTHRKITAFNTSTRIATVTPATLPSGSYDGSTFVEVSFGCDTLNTAGTESIRTGSNGPACTIYYAMALTGNGDTINIFKSNRNYDEKQTANSFINLAYANESILVRGYSIKGNLTNLDQPNAASAAALDTSNFPSVRPSAAWCIYLQNNSTGAMTVEFRNLSFSHASEAQLVESIEAADPVTLYFNQCVIGDGLTASQSAIEPTSGVGNAKIFKCHLCQINCTRSVYRTQKFGAALVQFTKCRARILPAANNFPIFDLAVDTTDATKGINELVITDCDIETTNANTLNINPSIIYMYDNALVTSPNFGGGSTTQRISILRNRLYNRCNNSCIYIAGPPPMVEIRGNSCYSDNTNSGGVPINLSPDASSTYYPSHRARVNVRGNICQAGSTNDSIVLDASASAVDDAYNQKHIYVASPAGGSVAFQTAIITDYTGSTKTAYVNGKLSGSGTAFPTLTTAPASGDAYLIYDDVLNNCIIEGNWCEFMQRSSANNLHCLLIGQGWDHATVIGNTLLHGDNGIVAKGEYGFYSRNKVYSGYGACLIKGGSFNTFTNNTFVTGRAFGGSGCFIVQDKSNSEGAVDGTSNHIEMLHRSKAIGNVVTDNIFAVIGVAGYVVLDQTIGTGNWATWPTFNPLGQGNFVDRNLYWLDTNGDGVSDIGGAQAFSFLDGANRTDLAAHLATWAAYTMPSGMVRPFPNNDAYSIYGKPGIADPANGNFAIGAISPAWGTGLGGSNIGAYQPSSSGSGGGGGGSGATGSSLIAPDKRNR